MVEISSADKEDIVLSEEVDEEKQRFLQELIDQDAFLARLKEADRARFIDSLPKEFDSMEMISAEASLKTRLTASISEGLKEMGGLMDQVMSIKYGHSQYSDSDAEAEQEDQVVSNSSSESSEESVEMTLDEAIERLVGAPIVQKEEVTEETFEVINAETETE